MYVTASTHHSANEPHEGRKEEIEGDEEAEGTSDVRHPAVMPCSCDQILTDNDIRCSCNAVRDRAPLGIDGAA